MGPEREPTVVNIGRLNVLVVALALVGCRGGASISSSPQPADRSAPPIFLEAQTSTTNQASLILDQAVFDPVSVAYVFGHQDGAPTIRVVGAPPDADPKRMAMLHDGSVYRLYLFKSGSHDTLYQFGFNSTIGAYEYGFSSIPQLTLAGTPADASTESFAMLHDGLAYRLYLRSKTRETVLYQFAFNPVSQQYEHGYDSIPTLELWGAPADVDHRSWAMLHDGSDYRYYARVRGSSSELYQFAYNPNSRRYEFGFSSIPVLPLSGRAEGEAGDFAMLHDGARYRLYSMRANG